MDRKLINPLIVTGIADAVRAKGKTTEPIKVADLPDAIMNLPEGGGVGEDTSALLDAIGVESREDTGMANGLAIALTDAPLESSWSGERTTADGMPIKDGVAFVERLKGLTIKDGENLQSFAPNAVVSKGRNLWDEEWENGVLNADGNPSRSYYYIIPKNYISVLPNSTICISFPEGLSARIYFYDRNKAFVSRTDALNKTKWITQIASGVYYIKFHYNVNTYNHNICINKSDSMDGTYTPYIAPSRLDFDLTTIVDAQGNQLFPDGELRSAGSVCDMVDYANNVAYKRIGGDEIHFSTMVAESDMWRVYLTGFSEAKSYGELNSLFGYTTKYSYNDVKNIDKTIAISSHGQYLLVHDSAITDVTAMRTKLSGVMLYYELAEPIIAPIGTTKAWYPVQNNGSEEAITDTIVPMNAEIRYRVDTESLLTQSASLLRYSNEVTGAENTSLGDAVKTLTDSYK